MSIYTSILMKLTMNFDVMVNVEVEYEPVLLSLCVESINYSVIFFSYNKSTNSTLSHDFSSKRTNSMN